MLFKLFRCRWTRCKGCISVVSSLWKYGIMRNASRDARYRTFAVYAELYEFSLRNSVSSRTAYHTLSPGDVSSLYPGYGLSTPRCDIYPSESDGWVNLCL